MTSHKRLISAAAAAIALVAGVAAVPGLAIGESNADRAPVQGAVDAPVVSALTKLPIATDALPALAASEVTTLGVKGVTVERSVRALVDGDESLYLTPAAGGVCLSLVGPGGATVNCVSNDDLAERAGFPSAVFSGCATDQFGQSPDCEEVLLYNVVPDGVRSVSVDVKSGKAPSVAVENNAYLVRVPLSQQPSEIRLVGDHGTVTQSADFSSFVR